MVVVSRNHIIVDSFNLATFQSTPSGCYRTNPSCRNDNLLLIERCCTTTECRMADDRAAISERGEEIDIQDDDVMSLNENDEIEINYTSDEMDDQQADGDAIINNKKKIECSASIMLPFSADVAFTAFSDLTRQPSWCKYLHSVEYIGLVNKKSDDDDTLSQDDIPLRSSKWTVGVKGLRFSWTASDTRIIRNKRIEWASTSGLKNIGSVIFTPSSTDSTTHMELCFIFVLPRVVSSLYRRLNIRKYTEDVMLADMLQRFRDVVIEEDL